MCNTLIPNKPPVLPVLRLERPVPGVESQPPRVEKVLLASVARVLEDVQANGIEIPRSGDRLTADDLQRLRQDLAQGGWDQGSLPGESPPKPLHVEHSGWGYPLDSAPEQPGDEHKLPRLVLVMDALDFLAAAMGSADILVWKDGVS